MPFKTKRQKERAGKRLLEFVEAQRFSYDSFQNATKSEENKVKVQKQNIARTDFELSIENNHSYILRELLKIAVLASVIIGLQLALRFSGISL